MKKSLLLLSVPFLFAFTTQLSAQCTGNINFTTQAEVDTFVASYDCSIIEGNLIIGTSFLGGSDIHDLTGLENITTIEGNLGLYHNNVLLNIDGLQNITSVGGDLTIDNNDNLANLDGLINLNSIGGNLSIDDNDNLINLDGLINLNSIEDELLIDNNDALTNLDGLQDLNSIEESFSIFNNNALTNIDGLINLNSIGEFFTIINNDALTNLDGLQNLNSIGESFSIINNNSLTSLSGLININSIENSLQINSNDVLTSLDGLQNLSSIEGEFLIYGNDALTSLEGLQNLTSIGESLKINNNDALTNLNGLQNLNSIEEGLLIFGNFALTNLDGLANINWIGEFLQIASNSSLATCCSILPTLSIVEGNIIIADNLSDCNSLGAVLDYCGEYQKIQAVAFFDYNSNGVIDTEEPILQHPFLLEPSADYSFPNQLGFSNFYLEEGFGEYQLFLNSYIPSLWEVVGINNPLQINYQDSIFNDTLHYFPITPIGEFFVQNIDLSSSITRCNQETNYWLTYTNDGNTTNNGYVELIPSELTNFVSANPPADSTAGDTLYWFYEDFYPTHSKQIHLIYEMPSVDELGEQINFEANIETDEGLGDDKAIISSELVCAYDPNDKLVTPAGEGIENYTLFGDTLEYTIRFQNTGNDTAFTVIIKDELNEHLDLGTFRPIASSHNVETLVDIDNRIATFTFNDIYLPDSFVNETASHGFVKFQIQGNENLESFTVIENTAEIFFDANPAIVTNTVLNTFTENIPSIFLGKVFLEGCYEGNGAMSTNLNEWLPLNQPFENEPYNYQGTESLNNIPDDMVDWVLIEARTGTPNISGTPGTNVVEQIAGILLSDGSIVNTGGTMGLRFLNLEQGTPYYFAIRHQNHLDVLSASPTNANVSISYDFSLSPDMALGTEQQKLSDDGTPLLFAGDANGDGVILNTDYDLWFLNNAVLNTYSPTDWNLDGTIQVTDYDLWFLNKAKVGIVELQD